MRSNLGGKSNLLILKGKICRYAKLGYLHLMVVKQIADTCFFKYLISLKINTVRAMGIQIALSYENEDFHLGG